MTAGWASLDDVTADVVVCRKCPRLVDWREQVAREKRGGEATMIVEADHAIPESVLEKARRFDWVRFAGRLQKVTD